MKKVDAERVRALLNYDSETGVFTWRETRNNRNREGMKAGRVHHLGYHQIGIDGVRYLAHRLAYLHVHGHWPQGEVDHVDRNRLNNRIENLRVVTRSENQQNHAVHKNNKCGLKGVFWNKQSLRWTSRIGVGGKHIHLGSFGTPEEAYRAYCKAAASLHTHNPAANGVAP